MSRLGKLRPKDIPDNLEVLTAKANLTEYKYYIECNRKKFNRVKLIMELTDM